MNLEKFVVVSGIGGVHRVAANRSNGLIIENIDTQKRKFVPARNHQFTPLESITIYTQDDVETLELSKVFASMLTKLEELPVVAPNATPSELRAYFAEVMPNYDRDRVHTGDMKKIVKWFNFLNNRELLSLEEETEEEETAEAADTETTETTEASNN